ncbi:MAG: DegV family protein [Thermomicrobiales bacterium]
MSSASRTVTVVTDSTADIPGPLAASLGIRVVPLSVRFGEQTFLDGVELSPAEFLAKLVASPELPKTSQPPTTAFETVFREEIDSGRQVVCLTIASRLSGTFNSARLAAEAVAPDRIHVVDSGTVTMHLGWGAVVAAQSAAHENAVQVTAAARNALGRSHLYALLETLEYVYKGGRIGKAAQLFGSMLAIKPILTVRDGEVTPLERVRTWRKALDRLVELARGHAPLASLAILHAGNPTDAAALADRLADLVPPDQLVTAEAGPVISTYAGPGAVGVMPLSRTTP